MVILTYVLPFIGILLALVVLHELGHFFAAKLAKVRVEEFGLGLPPRIAGIPWRGTLYSINWLPIGGFVRLTGEESAGIVIERIDPEHRSAKALKPGDRITHVNGRRIYDPAQFAELFLISLDTPRTEIRYSRTEDDGRASHWTYTLSLREDAPPREPDPDDAGRAEFLREALESDDPSHRDRVFDLLETALGVRVGIDRHSLGSKSRLTRIGILAAGAGVNAVIPIILFTIGALIPDDVAAGPVIVTSVVENAPADRAGILPGDRIVAVNGRAVRNTNELLRETQTNLGEDAVFAIERPAPETAASLARPGEVAIAETFDADVHLRLAPRPLRHVVREGETVNEIAALLGVEAVDVLSAWGIEAEELDEGRVIALPGGDRYIVKDGDTIGEIAAKPWIRTTALYRALDIDPRRPPPGTELEITQGATGIRVRNDLSGTVRVGYGFFPAVARAGDAMVDTVLIARNRIRSWIAGGPGIDLSGPVGIARITGEVVEQAGWIRLIELSALLSLNLAIINILPLPMLDGGRIFFILVEIARRGKRISPEREGLVHLLGFAALLIFIVVISYFDIVRAVSGEAALR